MPDYPWTAAEVFELVRGWPEEAMPNHGRYGRYGAWDDDPIGYMVGGRYVPPSVATALHAMAGLEWLATVDVIEIQFDHESDYLLCRWAETDGNSRIIGQHTGPTLLHAVSAAVRAVAS